MSVEQLTKHNTRYIISIASICLCFSCGMLFSKQTNIPDDSAAFVQNALDANTAIQQKDYTKALALISGTHSEDYYNR